MILPLSLTKSTNKHLCLYLTVHNVKRSQIPEWNQIQTYWNLIISLSLSLSLDAFSTISKQDILESWWRALQTINGSLFLQNITRQGCQFPGYFTTPKIRFWSNLLPHMTQIILCRHVYCSHICNWISDSPVAFPYIVVEYQILL